MAVGLRFKTIRQSITIPASPKTLYDAYINPKTHAAFTGAAATGQPKRGGRMTAWDGYIEGRYLTLKPGRRILQEWQTSEWPEGYPPSQLDLRLEKARSGTRLTMIHSQIPASQAADYRQGWKDYYWTPLTNYFKSR